MPSGKKRKRSKISTHKRKKRARPYFFCIALKQNTFIEIEVFILHQAEASYGIKTKYLFKINPLSVIIDI